MAMATEAEDNLCDWCGYMVEEEGVYSELCCRRTTCSRRKYHQNCIEEHLRKCKLAPDRLSGFPCPRGHGGQRRGEGLLTAVAEPCRGVIDSTHRKIAKKKKVVTPYVPPPKPAPGLKKKVPQPQQAVPPTKLVAAGPTPVRGGLGPSHIHAEGAAAAMSKAQLQAVVASIRKESKAMGIAPLKEQGAAKPAAARAAALATLASVKIQPGAGAAARLGKQEQSVYIPGMEPADPVPRPAPCPPPAAPAKPFNLHEQKSSFPSLGHAPTADNNSIISSAGATNAINALNPDHAKGFVTDLARYNALLGLNAYEDARDEEPASEWQAGDGDAEAEQAAPEAVARLADQVWGAYQHGMDAYSVQKMYDELRAPTNGWEGLQDTAAQAAEEPAAGYHSAYLEPEDVLGGVTDDQLKAAEDAQMQYMQQQSLMGMWDTPPAYSPLVSKGGNMLLAAGQTPQAVSLVHHIPQPYTAAKAPQLYIPQPYPVETNQPYPVETNVDEELYEDLLSLCLA